eukprot:gene7019-biopygen2384
MRRVRWSHHCAVSPEDPWRIEAAMYLTIPHADQGSLGSVGRSAGESKSDERQFIIQKRELSVSPLRFPFPYHVCMDTPKGSSLQRSMPTPSRSRRGDFGANASMPVAICRSGQRDRWESAGGVAAVIARRSRIDRRLDACLASPCFLSE